MKKFIAFMLFWLACGVYAYGTLMADLDWKDDHEWSILHHTSRDNLGICIGEGMLGPFGAVAVAFTTNFNQHGWHLWQR